jgi:hypothetical protein
MQNVFLLRGLSGFCYKKSYKIHRELAVGLSVKFNYIATWAAFALLTAILLGFF